MRLNTAALEGHKEFKLIGLGGTGGWLARPLALLCASLPGTSRLVFIDGDAFDPGQNRSRMYCLEPGNKAEIVRDELLPYFEDSRLTLAALPEYVTEANIGRLIRSGDYVVLCVDNHRSRKLISDHATTLRDVALFSVGNDGVGVDTTGVARHGTFGNVLVFGRRQGENLNPPITTWHPEIAEPGDRHPEDVGCGELLASAPQLLPTNLQAASLLLSTIYLYLCDAVPAGEVVFDVADLSMNPLPLPGPHGVVAR